MKPVKSVKMAALVVGTLAAAGSTAPAFAADVLTPTSLNGGLETAVAQTQGAVDTVASDALDSSKPDSLGPTVDAVTQQVGPLVPHALPTGNVLRDGVSPHAASDLLGSAPLLGGLPLGR